ncbi:MAG: hypothetical protein IKJ74_05160 [Clostridia bacterium]|nr:hypothetical protein [Clostridia bacterium]
MSEKVFKKAPIPNLLEQLKAIPIAKKSMKPEQLRQICLDYMRLQLSFQWLPSKDYEYVVDSQNYTVNLKGKSLHGGLPYVTIGTGRVRQNIVQPAVPQEQQGFDAGKPEHAVGIQCIIMGTAVVRRDQQGKGWRSLRTLHQIPGDQPYRIGGADDFFFGRCRPFTGSGQQGENEQQ